MQLLVCCRIRREQRRQRATHCDDKESRNRHRQIVRYEQPQASKAEWHRANYGMPLDIRMRQRAIPRSPQSTTCGNGGRRARVAPLAAENTAVANHTASARVTCFAIEISFTTCSNLQMLLRSMRLSGISYRVPVFLLVFR